ncbi:MAG: ClpX C4-type zinc finger protein [Candidatus Dormiibacterota bacterium]
MQPQDGENHCSFCDRSEQQVRKLIAGQHAFICDECVAMCNAVLTAEGLPRSGSGRKWPRKKRGWTGYEPIA